MSFPADLDEVSLSALQQEISRREAAHLKQLCPYCSQRMHDKNHDCRMLTQMGHYYPPASVEAKKRIATIENEKNAETARQQAEARDRQRRNSL